MYKKKKIAGKTWFKANAKCITNKQQKDRFKATLKSGHGKGSRTYRVRTLKVGKCWNVYTDKPY